MFLTLSPFFLIGNFLFSIKYWQKINVLSPGCFLKCMSPSSSMQRSVLGSLLTNFFGDLKAELKVWSLSMLGKTRGAYKINYYYIFSLQ